MIELRRIVFVKGDGCAGLKAADERADDRDKRAVQDQYVKRSPGSEGVEAGGRKPLLRLSKANA